MEKIRAPTKGKVPGTGRAGTLYHSGGSKIIGAAAKARLAMEVNHEEENKEERTGLMHEFYRIYRQMEKTMDIRHHTYFDIYGNNLIEIWKYEGKRRERKYICKVKEETETACYRQAIYEMLYYQKEMEKKAEHSRKEMTVHGKKAG